MGSGDIFIGALMGLLLGFPLILVALFLSFMLGSLISLILMALKKRTLKDTVPFAPFLIAATLITLFWGNQLLALYWGGF